MPRLEQADFPVAFLGSFNAGKSTIINAMIGREVLPVSIQATTAVPTILRRGETDQAFIYYIDEKGRAELWAQFCAEIGNKIGRDLTALPQEERGAHFERVKAEVREYERKPGNTLDSRPQEALDKLFRGWDKHKAEKKVITVAELKQYVDSHEDELFIDRIEAYVKDIDVPDDIVLVDLPGLAVTNARHVQFTKEYIVHRAKAFVVCMKAKHLLEGQEADFLEEINRRNPTILQRSFWVLNQWDDLNEHQGRQQIENFHDKVRRYAFTITGERFYKFSALNYFLLTCISNGVLDKTEGLKKHRDTLKRIAPADFDSLSTERARALLEHEQVRPFREFREALFQYLNTTAKDEFLANATKELSYVVEDLRRRVEPDSHRFDRNDNVAEDVRSTESHKQLTAFLGVLKDGIAAFTKRTLELSRSDLWTEAHTAQVGHEINEKILQLDRKELEHELLVGPDTGGMLYRLPALLEKRLPVSRLLRERLVALVTAFYGDSFSELLRELKELNRGYLPDAVLGEMEDKLGQRDLAMRLNGLTDSLFFDFVRCSTASATG